PTLGSWRYDQTKEENIIKDFKDAVSRLGIHEINGHVYADESMWDAEATPNGWVWQDIGNYYGAGARALNWRENQYDVFLRSDNTIGDTVEVVDTKPAHVEGLDLKVMATAAEKGSGDNSYIYIPSHNRYSYIR